MDAVRELTVESAMLRIIASIVLGGVLGMERGLKNRPAGLRTYILVCMGACIVMVTNQYVYQAFETGDPVRMAAQVISGIGFLGAGTIIVTPRNRIKGLTTAAGLWAAACTGLALGIGLYEVALIGGLAIFLVLTILQKWEIHLRHSSRIVDLYIELDRKVTLGEFLRGLRECNIEPSNLQLDQEILPDDQEINFIITLKGSGQRSHDEILRVVRRTKGVLFFEEL